MENENTDRTLQIALGSYDRKELRVQKNYIQEQCAGSECTCFQNGSRLLEQLQQGRRFDAVILCSQLEDMSGLELLTELRTTEARPPVLMIDEARRQNSSILCRSPAKACVMLAVRSSEACCGSCIGCRDGRTGRWNAGIRNCTRAGESGSRT